MYDSRITRDQTWPPLEPGPREQVQELGDGASANSRYSGWPNIREHICQAATDPGNMTAGLDAFHGQGAPHLLHHHVGLGTHHSTGRKDQWCETAMLHLGDSLPVLALLCTLK